MAYLDLNYDLPRAAAAGAQPASALRRHAPAVGLGALERRVIQLSRADGLWSLVQAGRIQTTLAWVFGLTRPNALADPRLEALRRYAVMLRLLGAAASRAEQDHLIQSGFPISSLTEIDHLLGMSDAALSDPSRAEPG